jgi:hypothetical protein
MQRWTSKPLSLPIDPERVKRVDVEFEDVRRDLGSFSAFVYVTKPDADVPGFAGAFSLFAQLGCWGEEGHCDWEREPVSPFDRRAEHHLDPAGLTVDVTTAAKKLPSLESFVVTVLAYPAGNPEGDGVLKFERLTALAYQ